MQGVTAKTERTVQPTTSKILERISIICKTEHRKCSFPCSHNRYRRLFVEDSSGETLVRDFGLIEGNGRYI